MINHIVGIVFLCGLGILGGIIGYFAQQGVEKYTVVWKDFGVVQNLHDVPGWTNIGAIYYQNMTLATLRHGNVPFYTGPGGNMCEPMGWPGLFGGCGAGTVGWANGTAVFLEMLNGGGVYAGQIQR